MSSYEFYAPTKIILGEDCEQKVGNILASYQFQKVVFIYGGGSIKKNGLYDRIVFALNESHISFLEISGVEPNPKLSFIRKHLKTIKNYQPDLILAVGGGSVIDSAKLLSHAIHYDGNPFDFIEQKAIPNKSTPVGVILTISAAGSEMSSSCVISNDEVTPFVKKGFNCDANKPLFALLNPKLTYSVSPYQTGCGIVDTMMHTLERFMNVTDESALADQLAIGLLKTVMYYGSIAYKDPTNYTARRELMIASSFSHNGITSINKINGMRVHGLEHALSGMYDEIPHGAGLSILWPAWCEYIINDFKAKEKLTILAKELFHVSTAQEGIDCLKQYFVSLNMPICFKDLNLKYPIDCEALALKYSNHKKLVVKDYLPLDYEAAKKILESVKE